MIGDLEDVNSLVRTAFSVNKSSCSLEAVQANSEKLKAKVEKYKLEVDRLKSKINIQNKDIEEALKQLTETNREKEQLKTYFKGIENEIEDKENDARLQFRDAEPDSKICLKVYKIL